MVLFLTNNPGVQRFKSSLTLLPLPLAIIIAARLPED